MSKEIVIKPSPSPGETKGYPGSQPPKPNTGSPSGPPPATPAGPKR